MSVLKDCDSCSGKIVVGMFDTIRVPKLGEDRQPVTGKDGKPVTIQLRLPHHILVESKLDRTGLAPAPCLHGLAEHPDPDVMRSPHARAAVSWVRSKHLEYRTKDRLPLPGCPLCFGEERPSDLTEAADGTPVGESALERRARLAEAGR